MILGFKTILEFGMILGFGTIMEFGMILGFGTIWEFGTFQIKIPNSFNLFGIWDLGFITNLGGKYSYPNSSSHQYHLTTVSINQIIRHVFLVH